MRFVEEHGNPMLVADVNRNANKVHDVPIDPLAPSLDVVVVVPTWTVAEGPIEPVSPFSPVAPVAPVAPVTPAGPVAPVEPTGPVNPVGPGPPGSPCSPVSP